MDANASQIPSKSTRQAFGETLLALGSKYPEIVVLDADLSKSTKSDLFAKQFPHRFFEMGIAEANMIGTAAGLSFTGKLPFLCSFGCFLTGRYDTIRMSIAYSQANVRLVGTHAGLGVGEDGWSQMGLEDLALMRALPSFGVFQPMDALETEALLKALVLEWKGPAYLRLTRQNLPSLSHPSIPFQFGKITPVFLPFSAQKSSEGIKSIPKKLGFLASGAGVSLILQALPLLPSNLFQSYVWNVHSLKPLDRETLYRDVVPLCDALFTIEDHSVIGGLGSALCEALGEISQAPPCFRLGVQDVFGESGPAEKLYEKFGLSPKALANEIQKRAACLL